MGRKRDPEVTDKSKKVKRKQKYSVPTIPKAAKGRTI